MVLWGDMVREGDGGGVQTRCCGWTRPTETVREGITCWKWEFSLYWETSSLLIFSSFARVSALGFELPGQGGARNRDRFMWTLEGNGTHWGPTESDDWGARRLRGSPWVAKSRHHWATSLSLFNFHALRRIRNPTQCSALRNQDGEPCSSCQSWSADPRWLTVKD